MKLSVKMRIRFKVYSMWFIIGILKTKIRRIFKPLKHESPKWCQDGEILINPSLCWSLWGGLIKEKEDCSDCDGCRE